MSTAAEVTRRWRETSVACDRCGQELPDGKTHIVCSPYGADFHVMYCPECCPCQRSA